ARLLLRPRRAYRGNGVLEETVALLRYLSTLHLESLRLLPHIPLIREEILYGRKAECMSKFWKLKQSREVGTSEIVMHDSKRFADPCCDIVGCHPRPLHEIVEPQGELLRSRRQFRGRPQTLSPHRCPPYPVASR